ncbi:ferredoxin [Candidatus Halobeggiatoa sp. HSG11]|nr:ferredoxin [Candidatus Halobeggiatoa sp. HSG11]
MQSSAMMKASDYSDYEFDLGFSNSKKTSVVKENVEQITIPYIPQTNQEIADDTEHSLRRFHLGDPDAISEAITENYVPALLHAYRDTSKVRYDYPLFLYPTDNTEAKAERLARSATPELWKIVESFAPGSENARILKDNLPRLERYLRENLPEGPVSAISALSQAGQFLQQELDLDANNNDNFVADFNKLLDAIQPEIQLLGYGRFTAIHLLNHAICNRLIPRQADFKSKVEKYINALKKLLEVEWGKSDESIEPKMMRDSVGVAGNHFDPTALSEVMTHSKGSVIMSPERYERVKNVLQTLETYLQENEHTLVRIIHLGRISGDWVDENITIEACIDPEPIQKAREIFQQQAVKLAEVFKSVRIAQLELDNVYDSSLHDPWFANFTWEAFSKEELLVLPAVIVLESADRVAKERMPALSRLLSSGQPIHVLVGVRAHNNPHSSNDEFLNYRFELGYFGICHRQAVVSQSSSARHEHLLEQLLSALDATRTSLHIINTGMQRVQGINAWLVAGAALESRANPFFHVNPEAGNAASDRMTFAGNPQPELDWAKHSFQYKDENDVVIDTELSFTFADYALLVPNLSGYFCAVPVGYDNEALIDIETYLSNSGWQDYKQLPFIWSVNENGELHKLIVSRPLIVACRDRLNYWHTLQELAGINNKYVEIAVQETKTEIQAEVEQKVANLQSEQALQLEQARRDTAGETMQKLSEVLLGMDLTATTPIKKTVTTPTEAKIPEETVEEPITEELVEETEQVVFDDPWIDSDLCTSCNDCLNINGMLFVYNDSKQATLGDLSSGTYAQLVEGAEICPANCIHPGKPNNLNEAGIEELIKRAEPFNKL